MSAKNLVNVRTILFEETDESIIRNELPVVIKGGCKNWPAYQNWTVDFFTTKYGEVEVPLSNYKKDPYQKSTSKPNVKIKDYLDSALRIAAGESDSREDLYSAGWFFCRGYCELLKDTLTPTFFSNNWADRVQQVIHFDTRSIIFGHPKVESPLHTDSFFVSTYFAMLKGQKRMRLVAPEHSKHVHNGYNVYDDAKLAELEKHGVDVYDCTIEEGDLVWFPPGWWHHVKNDTFTISLTTSFVSPYHFLPFEQQIRATILKPLLNLAKVKAECLGDYSVGPSHSIRVLEDSKFLNLESRYVEHFQGELNKTSALLTLLEQQQHEYRNRFASN